MVANFELATDVTTWADTQNSWPIVEISGKTMHWSGCGALADRDERAFTFAFGEEYIVFRGKILDEMIKAGTAKFYIATFTCVDEGNEDDPCDDTEVQVRWVNGGSRGEKLCEHHQARRLAAYDAIQARYPVNAPSDFDPDYCGERWDDDY